MLLISSSIMRRMAGAAALAASLAIVSSCSTPKDVSYMQDVQQGSYVLNQPVNIIKAMPDDRLNIIVHSKDPALSALFNLTYSQNRLGSNASNLQSLSGNGYNAYYTVDSRGDIDVPVLGPVHVEGLSREQIARKIKDELVSRDLVLDPTVTVEFVNPAISVLGEVNSPGRYDIPREHLTILEGLALAGDLDIQGQRKNVTVIRENRDGSQQVYKVDLTSGADLYASPAYYLQQNDVIYVEPTDTKKRQRSANGNSPLTASFWISIISLALSVAILIKN